MNNTVKPIKLDKKVKCIPIEKRVVPELIIGGYYYVCYDKVYACKLVAIFEDGRVEVEKFPHVVYKISRGRKLIVITNVLFKDELGLTPIQAMQHR